MNRDDEMIRRAMTADERLSIEELPLTEQIIETFRGRNRWLVAYLWAYALAFAGLTGYAIYRFATATEVSETVSWGVGVLFFGLMVALGKIWYWMELNKNVVTRELKRIELQLAELSRSIAERRA